MSMVNLSSLIFPPEVVADIAEAKLRDRPVFIRQAQQIPGSCPNCGGDGYLYFQFAETGPYTAPAADRKAVFAFDDVSGCWWSVQSRFYPCPMCRSREERVATLFEESGLEQMERTWTLDFYADMEGKRAALEIGAQFLNSLPKPTGWYTIFGNYGVGKSGMMRSLVSACCREMVPARYVRAEDILRELRTTFADDSDVTEDQMIQRYGRFQVLAIDEVDRVSDTRWSRSALFTLLDTRYKRRDVLATLLATNCDPAALPEGFEYLQSRMRDGERVEMSGKDLRG